MHILSPGNYLLYNGIESKAKELHQDNISLMYPDGTLVLVPYDKVRYIELGSNVLLRLKSEGDSLNGSNSVFSFLKSTEYPLHKKEDYIFDTGFKKFYLSGFLYDDRSIWQFSNLITLHYLHQLQNLIAILDPAVSLVF